MSAIVIYMEGGGDRRRSKDDLRQGMNAFLGPLKEAARKKTVRWQLVPSGSRNQTYDAFQNAVRHASRGETVILLVDSEEEVARPTRDHLRNRDGWDLSFASDSVVHLMVQVMETWIVADRDALTEYYGNRFNTARLPARIDLEREPKAQILKALQRATSGTRKGTYHKTKHAPALLKRIDQVKVRSRCRHCRRLFEELGRIVEAA